MSFYQQYPPVKESLLNKIITAAFYLAPIGFFAEIYEGEYLRNGLTLNLYFLAAVGLLLWWITIKAAQQLKRNRYLEKYGKRMDVICTKIRTSHNKKEQVTSKRFYFEQQGQKEQLVKITRFDIFKTLFKVYKKRGLDIHKIIETTKMLGSIKTQVGQSIPIIMNPENIKNCILDKDKLLQL